MLLRFIGKDGSMGLRHGRVYDVAIKAVMGSYGFIEVGWKTRGWRTEWCPYSSPAALAKNWESPR